MQRHSCIICNYDSRGLVDVLSCRLETTSENVPPVTRCVRFLTTFCHTTVTTRSNLTRMISNLLMTFCHKINTDFVEFYAHTVRLSERIGRVIRPVWSDNRNVLSNKMERLFN